MSRSRRRRALLRPMPLTAAAVTAVAVAVTAAVLISPNDPSVTVHDAADSGQYTITNAGTAAVTGWTLGFTLPVGTTLTSLWDGSYTDDGGQVTVTNDSWDATIQPAGRLQAAYQQVISAYDVNKIDFDIEGAAVANTAANARRDQAIAALQAADPALQVSFTLPVLPSGLTSDGVAILDGAVAAVNLAAPRARHANYPNCPIPTSQQHYGHSGLSRRRYRITAPDSPALAAGFFWGADGARRRWARQADPSMRTSGSKVNEGHCGWSADESSVLKVHSGRCGCCTNAAPFPCAGLACQSEINTVCSG